MVSHWLWPIQLFHEWLQMEPLCGSRQVIVSEFPRSITNGKHSFFIMGILSTGSRLCPRTCPFLSIIFNSIFIATTVRNVLVWTGRDKQRTVDRWLLSVLVNRPLVAELTPVTLLMWSSRVPSHSLGQLMSSLFFFFFSQRTDEQVVSGPVGMWTDVTVSKNCPLRCAIWVRGWEIWLTVEQTEKIK